MMAIWLFIFYYIKKIAHVGATLAPALRISRGAQRYLAGNTRQKTFGRKHNVIPEKKRTWRGKPCVCPEDFSKGQSPPGRKYRNYPSRVKKCPIPAENETFYTPIPLIINYNVGFFILLHNGKIP
jgi:hypothetical protein